MEMRVATLERGRVDRRFQLVDFVPPHPGPAHPRIDLDMEGALAPRCPLENAACFPEHGSQLIPVVVVEALGARGHEDENRPRDAGRPQFGALFDRRDTIAPGIERLEGLRY